MTNLKRILLATIFLMTAGVLTAHGSIRRSADKNIYLDLMEASVEAYTPEQIEAFIAQVEDKGITEHGYARLTSNIGILIAHGRICDKSELFLRMMDICMSKLAAGKDKGFRLASAGNDFAIKELCYCLMELEAAGTFDRSITDPWRNTLSSLKPEDIYTCQPAVGDKNAKNWCVYGASSECARIHAGVCGDFSYADRYLTDQLRFFDGNGMYMDPHQPMVYDFVTRLQFMCALDCGYEGDARKAIEENLLKSAMPTLMMQSVTGEIPFGGRSNQFLFNETFLAAVCEYYASWMKKLGRIEDAGRFKAAACRAVSSLDYWFSQKPVRHIKNRYPTESGYGCESYAYFKKYMVTTASWAYLAYRFADDSIQPAAKPEAASCFITSPEFHKVMLNSGAYTAEWELDAQKEYDSNGLGRLQKAGAPPVIAISSPCPSVNRPNYSLDIVNEEGLSIAPLWESYSVASSNRHGVTLTDGKSTWKNRLGRNGLTMVLKGDGMQTMTLPAFEFDGESHTDIECDGKSLRIIFNGWMCEYRTNGLITDSGKIYANRNGHFRRFDVNAGRKLRIHVTIRRVCGR